MTWDPGSFNQFFVKIHTFAYESRNSMQECNRMSEEKTKTADEREPLSPEELDQVSAGTEESQKHSNEEQHVKTPQ